MDVGPGRSPTSFVSRLWSTVTQEATRDFRFSGVSVAAEPTKDRVKSMRRVLVVCVLFLMTAGAAWAATSVAPKQVRTSAAPRQVREHARAGRPGALRRDSVLFGDKTIEPPAGRDAPNSIKAFRFAGKRTGTALSITVYVGSRSRVRTLVVGIFAAKAGGPGRLLASGSLSRPRPGTWNRVMIKSVAVKAGNAYWVAVLARGGTLYFRARRKGSCRSESYPKVHFIALRSSTHLSSLKGRHAHTCPISAYVSGKLSASGRSAPKSVGSPNTVTSPPPTPPVNTGVPTISGTAQGGHTLTTSIGTWSGSPTFYSYQWQECTSGCTNISNANGSSYTLQSSNVGDTIDVIVTATNSAGSASATSGQTTAVAVSSCNLNATTSNFVSQIAAASPGQTVCLASGDYSSFTGTSKSSPGITITSAPGATVTFNSGITLNLSSVQNFTLDGTAGGGTMSIGGQLDMETTEDALQNKALNLTFQNINFAAGGNVLIKGPENSNITFNRDTFVDGNANSACTGLGAQFFLLYSTATSTTQSGVTLENSLMVASGDLWNPNRAIEMVSPMAIENNVMVGYLDHLEAASCNHIDSAFWYSGSPGTAGGATFTGNLCYDDYNCLVGYDGTQNNTVTDNVCFSMERSCIILYSDVGSVVNHNTSQTSGADPSGCETMDDTSAPIQPCTVGSVFENGHKTGDPVGSDETLTNNVSMTAPNIGDSGAITTNTNNMWSRAGSPNISGSPTFVGGAQPTTWAGFELTSRSTGHAAGSDGLDVGIRAGAGGPPTGGGAAPVKTVAPAVTGAPTNGQTLTTTAGSWTITGNVPTATTYQWFDCPTSTFSAASCTPIEAQTPESTNDPTYTLQASDVGDYVFSEVTVTNANGQVNAISNAIGRIAS